MNIRNKQMIYQRGYTIQNKLRVCLESLHVITNDNENNNNNVNNNDNDYGYDNENENDNDNG